MMAKHVKKNQSVREVLVTPLSARNEAMGLVAIICIIITLMGLHFSLLKKPAAENVLQSCQRKDIFLKNQAPLMYRSLCSVAGDIIDLYEEHGKWPGIHQLEKEALPPFAEAFLPPGLKGYVWTIHTGDGWTDYFGVNKDIGRKGTEIMDPLKDSFLLRIIDSSRAVSPVLSTLVKSEPGKKFIWQVWHYPAVREYPGAEPAAKGWKWIVNSSDF